ncbi:MAG TPA: lasso peptide biosynthesis B2 protein [Pyrinomonadaceae bacterium]|nr:lasso peptide biosynthesis B2 protein [Pyrinomonadaceae bacterium]
MPVETTNEAPPKSWIVSRAAHYAVSRPGEALLLVRMAVWVAVLSLLIKLLPLPRVLSLVAGTTQSARPRRNSQLTEKRLAQLIDALLGMNVLCFTPTCWKRAPVLHRYLALQGIKTRIVFGVRKEKESLLAGHAWLEADDGRPLLEATPPRYTATYVFPA